VGAFKFLGKDKTLTRTTSYSSQTAQRTLPWDLGNDM
jgi:hypothetical protein